MRIFFLSISAYVFIAPAMAQSPDIFTLYRNSVLDPTMRIHIATFDTSEGERYNAENCNIAADLFSSQQGVTVRYWCEPGRFQKSGRAQ